MATSGQSPPAPPSGTSLSPELIPFFSHLLGELGFRVREQVVVEESASEKFGAEVTGYIDGPRSCVQGELEGVGREPMVLTHLEGACDPESPGGNWFTHPRMGTSLWGLGVTQVDDGKEEFPGTWVSLPERRQELSPHHYLGDWP